MRRSYERGAIMAVSEVLLSGSFLQEVKWSRDMIIKIQEHKIKDWPMGFERESTQPDDILAAFTTRGLAFAPYCHRPELTIGGSDAYMRNIGTIVNYVEHERQEEIQSAHQLITEILSLKARGAAIGLAWPNAHPDEFSRYFVIRGIPIAQYVRGNVNVGDLSAYDKNIETLNAYIVAVGAATYR
jgi:hypothetical protein